MKQILLMIAVVALVGCGKKTTPSEPETNAEPKVAAEKPEPAKGEPKAAGKKPTPPKPFTNTLYEVCAGTEDGGFVLHMGNAGEGLRGVRGGECGGGWALEEALVFRDKLYPRGHAPGGECELE